jgi:hypothetical protein
LTQAVDPRFRNISLILFHLGALLQILQISYRPLAFQPLQAAQYLKVEGKRAFGNLLFRLVQFQIATKLRLFLHQLLPFRSN